MNRKNINLRTRIYKQLMEGFPQARVAEILKVPPSTVQYHTNILLKEKAIRKIGKATPSYYRKGKNSDFYDQIWANSDGEGVKEINFYGQKQYSIHSCQFKSKIIKMPKEEKIVWEKEMVVNGTLMRYTHLTIPEGFMGVELELTVQECNKKILLYHFGRLDFTSKNIEEKYDMVDKYSHGVVKFFSKYGYQLGLPEQCGRRHIAFRKQVLDKLPINGNVGDNIWVDKTGVEDGKAHLETDSLEIAMQEVTLAEDMIQVKKELKEIDSSIDTINEQNIDRDKKINSIDESILKLSDKVEDLPDKIATAVTEKQLYRPIKNKEDMGYS